jgi:hypothetical protein
MRYGRALIFLLPCLLWGIVCGLYASSDLTPYFRLLFDWTGMLPWEFPFLDMHAPLSAIECLHRGIDVYTFNPCDIDQRLGLYSPIFPYLVPGTLTTAQTVPLGIAADFIFFAALPVVLAPQSIAEFVIYSAGISSSAAAFGVLQGNFDLLVFALCALAGVLYRTGPASRWLCYALCFFVGINKLYPLSLLLLVLRESWYRALAYGLIAAILLGAFIDIYQRELIALLNPTHGIPAGDYIYPNAISAYNLPYGLHDLSPRFVSIAAARSMFILLSAAALAGAIAILRRGLLALDSEHWSSPAAVFLIIGSILFTGCFFAGQNYYYRAIHLLFVLPGLFWFARSVPHLRWLFHATIGAILLLQWQGFLAQMLLHLVAPGKPRFVGWPLPRLGVWLASQAVAWCIASVLSAFVIAYIWRSPAVEGLRQCYLGAYGRRGTS